MGEKKENSVDRAKEAINESLEQLRLTKHSGEQVIRLQWHQGGITEDFMNIGAKLSRK